jgi:predicted nucleic acid-binding protein
VIGVDTSVVVRYLTGSPPAQAKRAAKFVDSAAEIGVSLVVLIETAHVLRTQYGVARSDVLDVLIDLLARENITALGPSKADVLEALVRARALPGTPIPDALVVVAARVAGALPIYTFDLGLRRHGSPVAAP